MSSTAIAIAAALIAAPAQSHDYAAMPSTATSPTEGGQSAFAAIQEVVEILVADPATDWSRVSIDALRRHLVDMDRVTLRSATTATSLPNGAAFAVTGADRDTIDAIRRMTSAHFSLAETTEKMTVKVQPTDTGSIVTATSSDPAMVSRIRALGLYGLLALGGHHQPHHLMMARGIGHH